MQLEKMVAYHKALADPTRLRILRLLADGEMNGQVLAAKLGVTPPTITHHAAKLREAGLITERREKNAIFFSLYEYLLRNGADAAVAFIFRDREKLEKTEGDEDHMMEMKTQAEEQLKATVLRNFFTPDGRLKHLPAQLKKKLIVLESLAERLELGKSYKEAEINAFFKPFHEDYATLRREMNIHQFMYREKEIYELNPREIWAKWQDLK